MAILPRILALLAALSLTLLVAAHFLRNELLSTAGTIVLAVFGLIILVMVFGGLISVVLDQKKKR